MKFHALLPIRDEADVIAQCITSLLDWADKIYIFDTGSVDDASSVLQAIKTGCGGGVTALASVLVQ